MLKRFLSVFMVVCLIALSTVSAFAANIGEDGVKTAAVHMNSINGVVFGSIEKMSKATEGNAEAVLSDMVLTENNGNVELTGALKYNGSHFDLNAKGKLYPVNGGGVYDNKLIFGELKTDKDLINIAQFRIEDQSSTTCLLEKNMYMENSTVLTMLLENTSTNEVIYIQGTMDSSDFAALLADSGKQFATDDSKKLLKEKVVNLMNVKNHLKKNAASKDDKSMEVVCSASATESSDTAATRGASVSYSSIDRLMTDLKSSGSVKLSNYSVPSSIFNANGWDSYKDMSSSTPFFYHRYGTVYSYYSTTQISVAKLTAYYLSAYKQYREQVEIKHGMIVEYDPYAGTLKVVYYDFGLDLNDTQLSMGQLTNRDVFISRYISGVLEEKPNVAKGAISLIPYLSTAASIWDSIQSTETQTLNTKKIFDATYELQRLTYGDKVIRGVVGDFSSYTLSREGNYALLEGEMSLPNGTFSTLNWGYKYTAYTYM